MKRRILHSFFRLLLRVFTHLNISGMENVPKKGGAILAINHLGIIDAPLIFAIVQRDDLTAFVAKKHQKNLILRMIINAVNGIWLNREEADSQAMRAARDHLIAGGLLGIAPEGTRSSIGQLAEAKTGVAYLAEKARVPIIPVAVMGTFKGMGQVLLLRRPTITVKIGKPLIFPPFNRKARDKALQKHTDEIMCRIAAMLPPDHRGVYAEHPRTRELLERPVSQT